MIEDQAQQHAAHIAQTHSTLPGVFPFDLSAALRQAAATPISASDPLARQRAIDQVIERGRVLYPEWFR